MSLKITLTYNRVSQKDIHLPIIRLQGLWLLVSGRVQARNILSESSGRSPNNGYFNDLCRLEA